MIKLNPPTDRILDSATVPLNNPATVDAEPVAPVRRPRTGLAATLIVGGVLAGIVGIAVARVSESNKEAARRSTVFAPGVRVANIALAGMGKEAGTEAVRSWAKEQLKTNYVTLEAPVSGKRFSIPLTLAGARYNTDAAIDEAFAVGKNEGFWERLLHSDKEYPVNVQPAFKIDEKPLAAQIAAVGKKIAVSPKNARAKMVNGVLQVTTPEQLGFALDGEATRAALLAKGTDALADGEPVTMVVKETAPPVTTEVLGKVNTLLASFSTSFGSSAPPRQSNIRKATGFINGTLLAPGEVFSYNDTVGPRVSRLGWRNAPAYENGTVVQSAGGGICQTSTTLYNAVLRANLKIVARRAHTMPVHYVDAGCDATVDYGSQDFKFENTTGGPLYIEASSDGGRLKYNLFGVAEAKPGQIDIVTGRHVGNRRGGFSVAAYRVIHQADGSTKRESLGVSSYRPMVAH